MKNVMSEGVNKATTIGMRRNKENNSQYFFSLFLSVSQVVLNWAFVFNCNNYIEFNSIV